VTPLPLFSSFPFIHSPPPRPHSLPLLTMGALRSPRTPQPLRCPLSPHPQPSAPSEGHPCSVGITWLSALTRHCAYISSRTPRRIPAAVGAVASATSRDHGGSPTAPPPRKSHKLLPSCHRGSFPVWPVSGFLPAPGGMPGGAFIPTPLFLSSLPHLKAAVLPPIFLSRPSACESPKAFTVQSRRDPNSGLEAQSQ